MISRCRFKDSYNNCFLIGGAKESIGDRPAANNYWPCNENICPIWQAYVNSEETKEITKRTKELLEIFMDNY